MTTPKPKLQPCQVCGQFHRCDQPHVWLTNLRDYSPAGMYTKLRQMTDAMEEHYSGKTRIVDGRIVKVAPPGEAMRAEDV